MKRDMGLIRSLLLKLEQRDVPVGACYSLSTNEDDLRVEGYEPKQVAQHLVILIDGGHLDAEQYNGPRFGYRGITWEGHDLLDSIRDPEIWKKTKSGALAAGGFTVDILMELAKGFIKKQLEERTGVKLYPVTPGTSYMPAHLRQAVNACRSAF